MAKKIENVESCPNEACNCKWGCCCGRKILFKVLGLIWIAAAIIACIYSCKVYHFNVLSAGWKENLNRMVKVYKSDAFIEYMTDQAQQAEDYFGLTKEDTTDNTNNVIDSQYASLDTLRDIAVNLWTDKTALQTCIDESRYTQAVNDMMTQGNQLFGVNGTPGNVIVDRENGNYILVSGAYPVDEFVNAINEYKNGAENYIAWGDEVKNVVEDMLANTPIRGDENAKFTIIEYTELLCPYCQRHSQEWTINSVIEQFPGEVNSVSRHFIIHGDEALQLASAMECVAELNPAAYHETFEQAFAKWL